MADWGRGRGRVGTWDAEARRRRTFVSAGGLADLGRAFADRLRDWAMADTGPGRLLPWLPVAFGLGIAIYFTAEREPTWWVGAGLTAACCAIAIAVRRRPMAFPLALAATAVAAGFAVATLKTMQ